MARVTHICTHCGYEGRPVKPPSDDTGEGQSDFSKGIARLANLILPGLGLIIRPLALFITLPIRLILWPLKNAVAGVKHCPNCGLPLMVPLKSDAGWIAKRKLDIKAGLVVVEVKEEEPVIFGREVVLPGDRKPTDQVAAPAPTSLPTLEELLTKQEDTAPKVKRREKKAPPVPKKPVDPDAW